MGKRIYFTGAELMERWQISLKAELRELLMEQYNSSFPPEWWDPPDDPRQEPDKSEWVESRVYLAAKDPNGSKTILNSWFSGVKLGIEQYPDVPYGSVRQLEERERNHELDQADKHHGLESLVFTVSDVLEFEKQHSLLPIYSIGSSSTLENPNKVFFTRKELMERWQVGHQDLMFYVQLDDRGIVLDRLSDPLTLDPLVSVDGLRLSKTDFQLIGDGSFTDYDSFTEYPQVVTCVDDLLFKVKEALIFEEIMKITPHNQSEQGGQLNDKEREELERLRLQINNLAEQGKDLDGNERRELGRLRQEKEKWDASIEAAVVASLFGSRRERAVTRAELWEELQENGFGQIPDSNFEKIWKALKGKGLTHTGGRPKTK